MIGWYINVVEGRVPSKFPQLGLSKWGMVSILSSSFSSFFLLLENWSE